MATTTTTGSRPSPSERVATRLRHLELHAPAGDAAYAAWIAFATTLVNASRSPASAEVKVHASEVLTTIHRVIDRLDEFDDAQGAAILRSLALRWSELKRLGRITEFSVGQVEAWLDYPEHSAKTDRAERVIHCIELIAPKEVEIEGRAGAASAQKRVYAALWVAAGRRQEIVLKEFLGDAAKLIPREMQAYPLSMMHPNIIQTYRLENPRDPERPFLAEPRIHPLATDWRADGLGEAALLLADVARALTFLADRALVHGDLKPDNIGYVHGRYLLLDFGVARKATAFASLSEPTGTLSTRAPEVIMRREPQTSAADVYALGASVFNSIFQRFPLIAPDDEIGEAHTPKRDAYVAELKKRLEDGWAGELDLLKTIRHEGFRKLLAAMLDPDPGRRPGADEVLRRAARDLQALAGRVAGPFFRPWEELDQLEAHLCLEEDMPLMPEEKWLDLKDRLSVLEQGLSRDDTEDLIDDLLAETRRVLGGVADPEIHAEIHRFAEELERQRNGERAGFYETLVERIRLRLNHRDDDWPELSPDSRSALATPLLPEYGDYFTVSTRAKARLLLEILELRKALPAY